MHFSHVPALKCRAIIGLPLPGRDTWARATFCLCGYVRAEEYRAEAFIGAGRATVGVIWNRFELYGGWQASWVEAVTLSGLTVGLRVWF